MKALRVALVHPYVLAEVQRGGERYLDDLAIYLAAAGHHVDVITSARHGRGVEIVDGVTYRRRLRVAHPALARRHISPMETFGPVALTELLRRRYDIVHALTPSTALCARATGHRTVYTTLGAPTHEQVIGRPNHLRLLRAAVRFSNRTTAVSHAAARLTESITGYRCDGLYPGVRFDQFTPDLAPREGPPVILFASDLSEPRKGLAVLAAAFAHILNEHPDARLQLAGPGDSTAALQSLEPEIRQRVVPAIDDLGPSQVPIAKLYPRATVTVLPSRWEAFGLVLVESLACGTPVVCNRDGGMVEIVSRPDVGRVAEWGDVAGLSAAVLETIALARRRETPAICVDHARGWDWQTVVGPTHEQLYAELVGSSSRRAR
jgi:phosphatidylinositol alpha-mannosyltransferase